MELYADMPLGTPVAQRTRPARTSVPACTRRDRRGGAPLSEESMA